MTVALIDSGSYSPPTDSVLWRAICALRSGRPVFLVGTRGGAPVEVLLPATAADVTTVAWAVRHTSGLLCAAMTAERARELRLPRMTADGGASNMIGSAVAVDAASGVATGISAADRARTLRVLADPNATFRDLVRPGHVIPLIAHPGGVLHRAGRAETAVDLLTLAGVSPIGLVAELVDERAEPLDAAGAINLGAAAGIPMVHAEEVVAIRSAQAGRVTQAAEAIVPTRHGRFRVVGFHATNHQDDEHLAMISSGTGDGGPPLAVVHVECSLGDALDSEYCDCRAELAAGLAAVAVHGGVLVYIKGHRGDRGGALGLAAAIIRALGIGHIRLSAGDALAALAFESAGVDVTPSTIFAASVERRCWPRSATSTRRVTAIAAPQPAVVSAGTS